MRVLVTGAGNAFGAAVVRSLLAEGHHVRVFGVDQAVAASFPPGKGAVNWYPGSIQAGGSIEPALSERQVLVHAACLDEPGKDAQAHAVKLLMGTRYARYGAEREQVDHFIHLTPASPGRKWSEFQKQAVAEAGATRGTIHTSIVEADAPTQAAEAVLKVLATKGELGKQPGRETDAVTA